MSKELEALKILKANAILFDDGTDFGASMLEAITVLDKALTPPTTEEVCEAYGLYLQREVRYNSNTKCFESDDCSNVVEYLFDCEYVHQIPPHLIILIGRFYEGVEEGK